MKPESSAVLALALATLLSSACRFEAVGPGAADTTLPLVGAEVVTTDSALYHVIALSPRSAGYALRVIATIVNAGSTPFAIEHACGGGGQLFKSLFRTDGTPDRPWLTEGGCTANGGQLSAVTVVEPGRAYVDTVVFGGAVPAAMDPDAALPHVTGRLRVEYAIRPGWGTAGPYLPRAQRVSNEFLVVAPKP